MLKLKKKKFQKALLVLSSTALCFSMVGFKNAGDTIKVGTWNIFHGNDILSEQRLLLKNLSLDIVGLQEVDEGTERVNGESCLTELGRAYYPNRFFAKTLNYKGGEYGTGILSKHKLLFTQITQLPHQHFEPRVMVRTEILIDEKPVSFYNVHLSFEKEDLRGEQIAIIEKAFAADPNPYKIMVGDFNLASLSELAAFSEYGLVNNEKTLYHTYRDGDWDSQMIDHIIYSKQLKLLKSEMINSPLSDHNALVAEFRLLPLENEREDPDGNPLISAAYNPPLSPGHPDPSLQ